MTTDIAKPIEGEVEGPKRNGNGKRAVAKVEAQPLSESDSLIQMIANAARDPSTDVEKMKQLVEIVQTIKTQDREAKFGEKMTKAQAKMRPIAADAENPQTRSKYASYAALDRVLRPIYTEDGFALSFNTGDDAPEGHVRVLCDVTNGGYTKRYKIDMPADGKGARGGDVMTKTHATGSAVSYGMRYLLKMIFNIAVGEADHDGNAAGATKITEQQVAELQSLIVDTNSDIARFCKYMAKKARQPVERLADIPAARFQDAKDALEAKQKAQI